MIFTAVIIKDGNKEDSVIARQAKRGKIGCLSLNLHSFELVLWRILVMLQNPVDPLW